MKKLKTIIEVEIRNIYIEDRYFSFDYIIKINGDIHTEETYGDSHDWIDDLKTFKNILIRGYATELALENFSFTSQ